MSLLKYESQLREPLVDGNKDYHQVTEDIIKPIEMKPKPPLVYRFLYQCWRCCFGCIVSYHEVTYGIGQWNLNKTIGWGWDITNFVWWVGIGHAGTLISAILLLFRQGWRTGGEPCCGSHDHLRGYVRRPVPDLAHGPCVDGLFRSSLSQYKGPLWVNFNSPCSGTYSRSPRISPFHYCSGIPVCCLTWQPCGTGPKPNCAKCLWYRFIWLDGQHQTLAAP